LFYYLTDHFSPSVMNCDGVRSITRPSYYFPSPICPLALRFLVSGLALPFWLHSSILLELETCFHKGPSPCPIYSLYYLNPNALQVAERNSHGFFQFRFSRISKQVLLTFRGTRGWGVSPRNHCLFVKAFPVSPTFPAQVKKCHTVAGSQKVDPRWIVPFRPLPLYPLGAPSYFSFSPLCAKCYCLIISSVRGSKRVRPRPPRPLPPSPPTCGTLISILN